MQPIVNIALRAAREAGEMIRRAAEEVDRFDVEAKGTNDFVTKVDLASEQIIIRAIQKSYPKHSIYAEESGFIEGEGEDKEFTWIIDPLDGTTNFIHGIPHFAISIGVKHKNQIQHAVVLDPIKQEEFTASRGGGAQLNGRRIRVSQRKSLDGALLGTGFPFRQDQEKIFDPYLETVRAFMGPTAGIRRAGAAALDLAYVAAGRLDGFWEIGLQEWDLAAGSLLVQEAGGLISDLKGGHDFLKTGDVVCAPPKVFKQMLQTIKPKLD